MTAIPEFSRPMTLDAARRERKPIALVADPGECAALAARFGLIALDALAATLTLRVDGEVVLVEGALTAEAVQSCVATAEPVPASVTAPIMVRLVPAAALEAPEPDTELELDDADLDVVDYDGAQFDLGEIVAQSMALALDPWPRHREADAILRAAGVKSEAEAGAFGPLAGLRDRLSKG